jgi:DNA-binding transcriptional MocR family regulator
MVAPCYYLACRIFEDSGLNLKAIPEGEDGIDLSWLEQRLREADRDVKNLKVRNCAGNSIYKMVHSAPLYISFILIIT